MLDPAGRRSTSVGRCGQSDRALLGNKTGATRLGFAVLLKMFQAEGRFPQPGARKCLSRRSRRSPGRSACRRPRGAATTGAADRRVSPGPDPRRPRLSRGHTGRCRRPRGLAREPGIRARASADRLLVGGTRAMPVARASSRHLPSRLDRLVRSVVHRHEEALCAALLARLPAETAAGLDALLKAPTATTSGEISRAPLLALARGRWSGKPAERRRGGRQARPHSRARTACRSVSQSVPSKVLLAYRRRVAAEELHELRRHPAATPADAARGLLPRARTRDYRCAWSIS